jgi:F-type H+-transporting ATPase subunit b
MNFTFTLIAQALVFAIFIWFTKKFVWSFLMQKVDERQKTIADGLAAAEKGTRALEEASVARDEQLKAARTQAQEILAAAGKQGAQALDTARAQSKAEAERIVAAAKADVDRQIAQAREELRRKVGDLAVLGAATILKREIDAKAHADVLKDLAAKI